MRDPTNISSILIIAVATFMMWACDSHPVKPDEDPHPRLVLTANQISGPSPLEVQFKGEFLGVIDTIQMCVPACIMFPGSGRTIVRYALPDTSQPAERFHYSSFSYQTGTYKAVMLLQSKYKDYYSDTLQIDCQ